MTPEPQNQNQPPERLQGWLGLLKGLTLGNIGVLALLLAVVAPAFILYKAVNDPVLMDRLLSSYKEYPPSASGCTLREVKARGSVRFWAISTGFAYQGSERWSVNVILDHEPSASEMESFCASLKLIVDTWTNVIEAAP